MQFGGQTPLKLAHAIEAVGRADPRHLGRFDRPRRGPRPFQAPARQARPEAAEERHRLFGRAVAPGRRRSRPAAGRAPVLRARRAGDGDHPRRERVRRLSARRAAEPRAGRRQGALSQRQDRPDQHGARQEPAAVRPLSLGRDRDRRRRALRRQGRRSSPAIMEHIEEAGIHSGDSACSLPPRSLSPETIARLEAETAQARAGARRRRPDERAICAEGRRDLRARSQSARLAHRAVRRQGDRPADRQDRQPRDGRRSRWRPSGCKPARSTMSASRRRCSRSRASPASTPCSARKCARPAR